MKNFLGFGLLLLLFGCEFGSEKELAVANGLRIYQQHCMACHGEKGEGNGLLYPPLQKSDYMLHDSVRTLQHIVQGVSGPMVVNGVSYRGIMPSEPTLNDVELGYLMTYLYNSWGRVGGHFTPDWIARNKPIN
jgi:mono/diheme cytochrome c family protein